jgi:hypothetical protein
MKLSFLATMSFVTAVVLIVLSLQDPRRQVPTFTRALLISHAATTHLAGTLRSTPYELRYSLLIELPYSLPTYSLAVASVPGCNVAMMQDKPMSVITSFLWPLNSFI